MEALLKCELELPCGTYCQNITGPKSLSRIIWGWTRWPPEVPSSFNHSVILWFKWLSLNSKKSSTVINSQEFVKDTLKGKKPTCIKQISTEKVERNIPQRIIILLSLHFKSLFKEHQIPALICTLKCIKIAVSSDMNLQDIDSSYSGEFTYEMLLGYVLYYFS